MTMGGMTGTSPRHEHIDIDHDRVLDDELEVEPDEDVELPDHLDLPLDVPEADAVDQETVTPLDDDEHR